MTHCHNYQYLKDTRRNLRANLTTPEAVLWRYLQKKQLDGRKFRRPHSIENYIVDFYCASERLIIEVDGSVHDNLGRANADFI
jgi:very-short-patch-repair endonuclease